MSSYICGACEIFIKYMFQNKISISGDINESANFFINCRFYGTIWLLILGLLVFMGVKFVSKIGPIALICVLLSALWAILIKLDGKDKMKKSYSDILASTEFIKNLIQKNQKRKK